MRRIAVIGNAGGGKSTLCARLGRELELPVYALDHMLWKPGWVKESPDIFAQKHKALLAQDSWIIDGWGPWETIEGRFQAADTIIFVDLPLHIHYWWACKRQFMCLFHPRPDGPDGCPMLPMTGRLLRMIWDVHTQARPQLIKLLDTFRATRQIIDIRSPRELHNFSRL